MTQTTQSRQIKTTVQKQSLLFLMTAGLILLASCTPKTIVAEANRTDLTEHLSAGKTIFENSCVRCHELPNPTAHSAQDWVGIMNWMAPKAKLSDEQHALVYDYVVSVKKIK